MRQVGAVGYVVGCLPEGRERHSSRRTLAGVIAIGLLAAGPSAGQVAPADATTAETTTGIPPRTPWGDPDLQGIWNNSTITPLERPSEFAGQPFLTELDLSDRRIWYRGIPALPTIRTTTSGVRPLQARGGRR